MAPLDVVTGAFGFTGRAIARALLAGGRRVRTLTGHPDREDPLRERVEVVRYAFGDPRALAASLWGASTLYNTYWVRFPRGKVTFEKAIENSKTLFAAAREAGVRRVVHTSISNPSLDSPLPYFRGKALVEVALRASGLSHAILRPTVIFGEGDVLLNNIAWLVRRFPVFVVPGAGDYALQPVFVEDLARIAVREGTRTENVVLDAVGPEVHAFDALLRLVARSLGRGIRLLHAPPPLAWLAARFLGLALRDVSLTRDEVEGLMAGLLVSKGPPTAETRLSGWLARNADRVGRRYVSEIARHYR